MKKQSSFKNKLISYPAFAAAAIALNNESVNAQIIYTDISPDCDLPSSNIYELDLNNDGIVDFHIKYFANVIDTSEWCSWGGSSIYISGVGSNEIMNDGIPLSAAQEITSQNNWDQEADLFDLNCHWTSGGGGYCVCWPGGNWGDQYDDAFTGLKLVKDNQNYYGWLRLSKWAYLIKDYAYESIAESSITAGAIENCDSLQITNLPFDSIHSCVIDSVIILQTSYPTTTYLVNLRWEKDNVTIPGATSSILTVNENGVYKAIIDGYGCADTTNSVTVTYNNSIAPPPTISQHLDTLISSTQSNYIWYYYSSLIPGATNQSYPFSEDGMYHCRYTDSTGCPSYLANFNATTCESTVVTITNEGTSLIICNNDSLLLCSTAIPFYCDYQWYFNDQPLVSETSSCLTTSNSGTYKVVIKAFQGCIDTSDTFQLFVDTILAPEISILNDSTLQSTLQEGNQWYLNGNIIPGATDQYYIALQSGQYEVEITDSTGCSSISDPIFFYVTNTSDPLELNEISVFVLNYQLHIEFNTIPLNSNLLLTDVSGKKLFESSIIGRKIIIDVSNYATGIYFVIVVDKNERRVRKITISE